MQVLKLYVDVEKQLKLSEQMPGKTVSLPHIMSSFLEFYNIPSNLGFGGIQDLKETGKVWMADPVTYPCLYLIVPVKR